MKYYKTFKNHPSFLYTGLKARTPSKKGIKLLITKEEFLKFIDNNKEYKKLHHIWQENGFPRKLAPSVDRINNKGHYTLKNIQIMTAYENSLKSDKKDIPGIDREHLIKLRNKIIFDLKKEGYNGSEIGSIMNLNRSIICRVLQGKYIK